LLIWFYARLIAETKLPKQSQKSKSCVKEFGGG